MTRGRATVDEHGRLTFEHSGEQQELPAELLLRGLQALDCSNGDQVLEFINQHGVLDQDPGSLPFTGLTMLANLGSLPGDRSKLHISMATVALRHFQASTLFWEAHARQASDDELLRICDSHSPWQRGSNENTNGLLRDYLPKGTDLNIHSAQHLLAIENELNRRPRRVLDGQSPAALFDALLPSPTHPALQR